MLWPEERPAVKLGEEPLQPDRTVPARGLWSVLNQAIAVQTATKEVKFYVRVQTRSRISLSRGRGPVAQIRGRLTNR